MRKSWIIAVVLCSVVRFANGQSWSFPQAGGVYTATHSGPVHAAGSAASFIFSDQLQPSDLTTRWEWKALNNVAILRSFTAGELVAAMSIDGTGVIRADGVSGALSFRDRNTGYKNAANDWYLYADEGVMSMYVSGQHILKAAKIGGNVTIGGTAVLPDAKLHVAGKIVATEVTATNGIVAVYAGQDIAEWVDSTDELEGGTVVVLDSAQPNAVIASTKKYDSRVAGVVSGQPGIVLGRAGESRYTIAASGRVRVRVDASNGPIEIGDLLVTSDRRGYAMKSTPVELGGSKFHRPGTLLGKALQPLTHGEGEILVLLSLQ